MDSAALQLVLDLERWQIVAILVKTGTYGATFAAAGGMIFLLLFRDLIYEHEDRTLRQFVMYVAWIAIFFSVARIVVMNVILSDDLSDAFDLSMTRTVMESSEGIATSLRLACLFAVFVLCRHSMHGIAPSGCALLAASIAATSFALSGHAGDGNMKQTPAILSQGLLCLHLITGAFWLGSLWPLQRLTHGIDIARIAAIIKRFGEFAVWVVCVLFVAGLVLLWVLLATPEALWTSAYGQLFIAKLCWVTLLLALATWNKVRLTPLLLTGDRSAIGNLRYSIIAESAVAGLILLATACLTTIAGL